MFESKNYIFIEMEYISGEQLKKTYDNRLLLARNNIGSFTEEELR
jgi:hypothetical protein